MHLFCIDRSVLLNSYVLLLICLKLLFKVKVKQDAALFPDLTKIKVERFFHVSVGTLRFERKCPELISCTTVTTNNF